MAGRGSAGREVLPEERGGFLDGAVDVVEGLDVVLDEDGVVALGGAVGGAQGPAAAELRGVVGVHVAVLEEAETELLAQQAACGDVDAFLGHLAAADEFDDVLGAVVAAELVQARIERGGQSRPARAGTRGRPRGVRPGSPRSGTRRRRRPRCR
ncbi:hypothetical protein [Streptomyces sp. NPDC005507]|uniref:hypothetical protein n=1 Tax=Streptomyces sp. NPDC005507 TaxID=3154885 RepID=UPI0033B83996